MWKYVFICLLSVGAAEAQEIIESTAQSGQDTVIFGAATNADGTQNEVLLEQPENAPNPLGNPIIPPPNLPANNGLPQVGGARRAVLPQIEPATVQNSMQNPDISDMTPQQMNNEIQNKLYQEGNRVYDVQSYPAQDLQTINQNGQDNAVTNYPAY